MKILEAEKRSLHFALMKVEFYLGAGGGKKKSGQALVDCLLKRINEKALLIYRLKKR